MSFQSYRKRPRAGLTLIELMIVVAILAILAGTIMSLGAGYIVYARDKVARASLAVIRDAIMGTTNMPGYLSDTGQLPNTLADLFIKPQTIPPFDPTTGVGWRGPYLQNATGTYVVDNPPTTPIRNFIVTNGSIVYGMNNGYGNSGDPVITDPWGNAIILQRATVCTQKLNDTFARLISAGPNGVIDTPPDYLDSLGNPYPTEDATHHIRGDDIVVFLQHSDSSP